jgi:hypothetical protein
MRDNGAIVFALLTAGAAVAFYAISLDRDLYAPGGLAIEEHVGGTLAHIQHHVPRHYANDFTATRILRKAYSVVAFAIVGFLAAPLFAPNRRALSCCALVALFSTTIEIGQKVTGAHESLLSNAFDVGCGAAGGLLGAVAWDAFARLRGRR